MATLATPLTWSHWPHPSKTPRDTTCDTHLTHWRWESSTEGGEREENRERERKSERGEKGEREREK